MVRPPLWGWGSYREVTPNNPSILSPSPPILSHFSSPPTDFPFRALLATLPSHSRTLGPRFGNATLPAFAITTGITKGNPHSMEW